MNLKESKIMRFWFTADPHFDHDRIIYLSKRPFNDVRHMNESILDAYNTLVKPEDTLYILGDFCWGNMDRIVFWREQIKCKNIIFFIGNHDKPIIDAYDRRLPVLKKLFRETHWLRTKTINGQPIAMSHYPQLEWDRFFHGSWNLFGHVHGNLSPLPGHLALDVGVDVHQYKPVSFEQVQETMELRKKFNAKNEKEYVK
jgi:calcineurin-like phosphoesterase family protein